MTQEALATARHDTRADAVGRVGAASADRSHLRDQYESVKGTSGELQADALLRAANHEVAARERWLQWVEEGDY